MFACLRALRVPDIFPIHQGDTTASSLGATLSRTGSAAPHSKPETQPKVVLGLANGLTGPFDIHLEVENHAAGFRRSSRRFANNLGCSSIPANELENSS